MTTTPQTAKYQLPEQGFTVIRWAHDLAKGRAATVVEAAVQRVRRPDGALAVADITEFKKAEDGPLSVLRRVLELEAMEVRRWSKDGFGRFHKRSAGKRAERICRESGVEAAVDWVLANGSADKLCLDELRDMLGPQLYQIGAFDEDFFRSEVARSLSELRRRRQTHGS